MKKLFAFLKKVYLKIKDPYFRARSKYIKYYDTLPINDKSILLESQQAKEINGNIFYIAKYLASNPDFADYTIYISTWGRHRKRIKAVLDNYGLDNIKLIIFCSDEYFRVLASAKYLINDNTFHTMFIKKPGQVYLNTWHGTPLKALGRKMETGKLGIGNAQKNFADSDFILFPNILTRNAIMKDYMVEDIAEVTEVYCGYPRNTAFFDDERRSELSEMYNPESKHLYAYMPTFRGSISLGGTEKNDAYLKYYLYELDSSLSDNELLYVNLHPISRKNVDFKQFKHIFPFPASIETYEFLNIADCLVTDYSSVFFDYANTRRKIVLFTYDEKEYLQDRGLYIDINKLPFPKAHNIPSLLKELREEKQYDDTAFIAEYCSLDCKNATELLCDLLFHENNSQLKTVQNHRSHKENILIYSGNLAGNGITSSLRNVLNELDLEERNYYLAFRTESASKNQESFDSFPDKVKYFAIHGDMNISISERVIRKLFKMCWIKADLYVKLMRKRISQNWIRAFGISHFDQVIQYNGYENDVILMWSQFAGSKTIFVHSDMNQEITTRKNQRSDVLRFAYRAFDKVAIVTDDLKESVIQLGAPKNKICIVHNIINWKQILEKSELQLELGSIYRATQPLEVIQNILISESVKFISVGRFSPEKGHIRLIKAFKHLLDECNDSLYMLIIGGLNYFKYYEKTWDLIKELNLTERVILIQNMPNVFPLLKKCDYFVLSSYYEGFGLVIAEADILGKPVISTDVVGPRTFLKENEGVLVPNNEDGIYQGMASMLKGKVPPMTVDYEEYNKKALLEFESLINN